MGLLDFVESKDLKQRLQEIRSFVHRVWDFPPLLKGFTDHGPFHSDRVITKIDELLGEGGPKLSEDEAFVLATACYLHDVGMQDYGQLEELNSTRPWNREISWEERKYIREQHARRIRRVLYKPQPHILIQENRQRVDLPPLGPCKRYVAEIAYGHSTAGFSDVSKIPSNMGPTGRDPFRFALLAALILLGDECDLDHSRALHIDNAGIDNLDPETILHLLKHLYISSSRISIHPDHPSQRQIKIAYGWPANGNDVQLDYRRWIECKIISQINLVHSYLKRELGIEFDSLRPFIIAQPSAGLGVEDFPPQMRPFLAAERARIDIANLTNDLREMKDALDSTFIYFLIEPENPGGYGARELALILISEICTRYPEGGNAWRVIELDIERDPTCSDPMSFGEIILGASPKGILYEFDVIRGNTPVPMETLKILEKDAGHTAILLCNAHALPTQTKKFMINVLIPFIKNGAGKFRLFMTSAPDDKFLQDISASHGPNGLMTRLIPKIGRADLMEFLRRHTLYPEDLIHRQLEEKEHFTQEDARLIAERFGPVG